MKGITAFREAYFMSGLDDEIVFTDFESRKMRYKLLWAMVENTAYRDLQKWSKAYKLDYGLYKYIRAIYNPSYRLSEFWKTHLLGGRLDPEAGDGKKTPSALPIVTKNESLRPAIAQVWKNSNWQIKKDVLALWGSSLGDAGIKIIDDPEREKVYLKLVHPGTIKNLLLDDFGNVKAYELEEIRPDPRTKAGKNATVLYREVAERVGETNVIYKTYLDNRPYAWDDDGLTTWQEEYGFIPLVVVQHNNVGLDYGWSEIYPDLSKFREVDDLASKLSDQIRKLVDAPWLLAGVKKTDGGLRVGSQVSSDETTTATEKQKGRQEVPIIYANDPNAKAQHLVAPLDIAAVSAHIDSILKNMEQDYPELSADIHNIQGDISGRALRINQAPATDKVEQRRPNYDHALVRAHQMAIAIGGFRKYKGFDGFDLGSYDAGDLDHAIGERPVFANDPMDDLDLDTAFWTAAKAARDAGVPLLVFLKQKGWSEKQIKEITESPEYKARMDAINMATEAAKNGQDIPDRRQPKLPGSQSNENGSSTKE